MSPARLAHMRRVNERFMQDQCDLISAASPRVTVATNVACNATALIGGGNPRFASAGDRSEIVATWRISLPAGTDVAPGWLVAMGATTRTVSLRGRMFTVVGDIAESDEVARDVLAVEAQ